MSRWTPTNSCPWAGNSAFFLFFLFLYYPLSQACNAENQAGNKENRAAILQKVINSDLSNIGSSKQNLVAQLENTYIVRPDGTKEKVQHK